MHTRQNKISQEVHETTNKVGYVRPMTRGDILDIPKLGASRGTVFILVFLISVFTWNSSRRKDQALDCCGGQDQS